MTTLRSNVNTVTEAARSMLTVRCPWDGETTEWQDSGSNLRFVALNYRCPRCRADICIEMFTDGIIVIDPKRKEEHG